MTDKPLAMLNARSPGDVGAMALVAQANLLQLRLAAHKRFGAPKPPIASPGFIRRYREALIDWRDVKTYDASLLALRTHEVWGQFCLFCWAFGSTEPDRPPAFAEPTTWNQMRCPGGIGAKLIEIERGLWRLRHEDRLRRRPDLRSDPAFHREYKAALDLPMLVFGKNVRVAPDEDLLLCTCEYAGMLAACRWTADDRWQWAQPGIMDLDAQPTAPAT